MRKLALISVTDKTGVEEFAKSLEAMKYEILSTGGTAETLKKAGVDVTAVSFYTQMPEILGGRLKTLHPKIHGGLLGIVDDAKHAKEMREHDINPIEVLAVNLYPFEQTVRGGAAREEAIENIDIGGPAMIRAAAKNSDRVSVVVDPADYDAVLKDLKNGGDKHFRTRLQAKAFAHTAFYDSLIAEFLGYEPSVELGGTMTIPLRVKQPLRYGENPHQKGALYVRPLDTGGVANASQLWGKELSYNNLLDADAAWELACDLMRSQQGDSAPKRSCVIVKHGNPCGAAWGEDPSACFMLARAGDPVSAFGGIVAIPGAIGPDVAEAVVQRGNFFEVVLCSKMDPEALDFFRNRSGWGQDVRILEVAGFGDSGYLSIRTVRGGALVQDADTTDPVEWRSVTRKRPSTAESYALRSAWKVVKHVKSNAIVIASQARLLGVGAGQMNRVQSVRLAIEQAGADAKGAVLASDAFFPFPDSVEVAAKAGIAAIVQPGGSKKDADVIEAANRLGLAMVFTGVRHFRH